MDLDFSPEQEELRRQVRRVLSQRCTRSVLRRVFDGHEPYARDLWREMATLGWLAVTVPQEFGGSGLGHIAACVLAEEVGRLLAPVPFSSSLYLAIEAVAAFGSVAQKQRYLPRLADGTLIGTAAFADAPGPLLSASPEPVFRRGRLNGMKVAVADGATAGIAVVSARAEGGESTLCLALLDQAGVRRERSDGIDSSRPLASIRFVDAAAEPLGGGTPQQLLDRASVMFAFEQLGGAQAALEQSRDYALSRYAFGRPIGSFQAIKHKLANVYVANELARSHAYNAACLLEDSLQLPVAAASARVAATDAFENASREMIQVHGGIAFTWESDCHLYYRRSRQLALQLGPASEWRQRLLDLIEHQQAA